MTARQLSLALCLAAAVLAAPRLLAAQATGTIAGRVTAADTQRPVAGAGVALVGTSIGVVSDADGRYRIPGLVPGEYRVRVATLGYQATTLTVRVRAGALATVDFSLSVGSVALPGIVVSAARTAQSAERLTATSHALARQEVRASPARTPDELLRELPGVELPRTSGVVAAPEQIVSIRGVDEGRTLVMLDNLPLNDPWGEWVDWQQASVFSLDRVEVTEGGGSSLYGNYAMGGIVQLVSRPIEPRTFNAIANLGSRDLADVSAYGSDIVGRWALAADGALGSGGGYVLVPPGQRGPIDIGNSSSRRNANLRGEYALGADRVLSARFSLLDEDRHAGTPLAFSSRRIGKLALGTNLGDVAGGRLEGDLFGTLEREVSHQSVTSANRASEQPALVQSIPARDLGGSLLWSHGELDGARLALGGDFRYVHGTLDETDYTAGTVSGSSASGGSQLIGGVFVQGSVAPVAPLRLEASLRADGWRNYAGSRTVSDSGSVTFAPRADASLSPRLGARLRLAPGLALRGSIYRAFRAPTLSEQYRGFISGNTTFLPNPQLGPEHLTGGDVGVDWQPVSRLELRATAFTSHMTGLTDFQFLKPGFLMRQNEGSAHSRGIEGEAALQAADWLRLGASYNYDDARTAAGTRVRRVPLHREVAHATVGSDRTGRLELLYRHEGTMAALSGAVLPPFDVFDATYRHALRYGAVLEAQVQNLADRRFVVDQTGSLQLLGLPRTLRIGVDWTVR